MKNRDYILFMIGNVFIMFSYIMKFKDVDIAGFMHGLGLALITYFVLKGAYVLIKKRISQSN